MAERWAGFTEEDLRKFAQTEETVEARKAAHPSSSHVLKQQDKINGTGRKNVTRLRMLQKPRSTSNLPRSGDIPDKALLYKTKDVDVKSTSENLPLLSEVSSADSGCGVSNGTESSSDTSSVSSTQASPSHGPVYLKIKEDKSYEVISPEQASKSSILDEFEMRHKMMEEQNRRRKELLAKALADRKKQTHEEARRLQQIQDELQKLDMLLSNDVAILRNQIEEVSLEFMEAQKRYNRAEKEFLDAKMHLFSKLERKELLTEHLCTIIEQNEMRKARKLSELMDKLELSTSVELSEEERRTAADNKVILSPLRALDEVSYSMCNTLKHKQTDENTAAAEEKVGVPGEVLEISACEQPCILSDKCSDQNEILICKDGTETNDRESRIVNSDNHLVNLQDDT
ncbi:RAB6-interacting golgin [Schistocerca cancellata]|uniref:RAB6-interacting golgin n=1 Tax=Schistocerca cancellata TaxID=274614 RepID=UPI00211976FB|nr:RAB6-interacting golgin [Schistocerca cancellata]